MARSVFYPLAVIGSNCQFARSDLTPNYRVRVCLLGSHPVLTVIGHFLEELDSVLEICNNSICKGMREVGLGREKNYNAI